MDITQNILNRLARLEAISIPLTDVGDFNLTIAGTASISGTNTGDQTVHEILVADRTYYVRTDGHDTASGLNDTNDASTGAFLTVQHAVDTIYPIDLSTYNVTVQIVDGTYTGAVVLNGTLLGSGIVTIKGNAATPDNVLISTSGVNCFTAQNGAVVTIQDMKLTAANSGGNSCLVSTIGSRINFSNIDFGACQLYQIRAEFNSYVHCAGNYTITGGARTHACATVSSYIDFLSITCTITGTPDFSYYGFVFVQQTGAIGTYAATFTGATTGKRFHIIQNGAVNVNGAGLTLFPGDAAGDTASGGIYDGYPVAVMTQTYSTADATLAALTSISVTNNVTGSGSTVADPESSYTRATQRNNFFALADQYNKLRANYLDLAQFVNAIVDDLQVLGILQ